VHRYELDVNATLPVHHGGLFGGGGCASIIVFETSLARQRTLTGDCAICEQRIPTVADNDSKPDETALKLRAAGLGVIGTGAYRFDRSEHRAAKRFVNLLRDVLALPSVVLLALRRSVARVQPGTALPSRHTMVSNDGDDELRSGADAKLQRLESAGR
jgi:hypothetical protein